MPPPPKKRFLLHVAVNSGDEDRVVDAIKQLSHIGLSTRELMDICTRRGGSLSLKIVRQVASAVVVLADATTVAITEEQDRQLIEILMPHVDDSCCALGAVPAAILFLMRRKIERVMDKRALREDGDLRAVVKALRALFRIDPGWAMQHLDALFVALVNHGNTTRVAFNKQAALLLDALEDCVSPLSPLVMFDKKYKPPLAVLVARHPKLTAEVKEYAAACMLKMMDTTGNKKKKGRKSNAADGDAPASMETICVYLSRVNCVIALLNENMRDAEWLQKVLWRASPDSKALNDIKTNCGAMYMEVVASFGAACEQVRHGWATEHLELAKHPDQCSTAQVLWACFGPDGPCHETVAAAAVLPTLRSILKCCASCGCSPSEHNTLKACGGCELVWYCSTECHRRDWRARHRDVCRAKTKKSLQLVVTNIVES